MPAAPTPSTERPRSTAPARVLITGASSGIGRATAIEFARRGSVHLVLVGRRRVELELTGALAQEAAPHGAGITFDVWVHDLALDGDLDALLTRVVDVPPLDVVVNNAGAGSTVDFDDPAAGDDIDQLVALNLRAPLRIAHAARPSLVAARGALVNVASVAGLVGGPSSPVYAATKWALVGASESLQIRWKPQGVHVACILPGPVPTPGWPHAMLAAGRLRRITTSTAERIARDIVDAATGRRRVMVVRPRTYAVLPWLRVLAPGLLRRWVAKSSPARQD